MKNTDGRANNGFNRQQHDEKEKRRLEEIAYKDYLTRRCSILKEA